MGFLLFDYLKLLNALDFIVNFFYVYETYYYLYFMCLIYFSYIIKVVEFLESQSVYFHFMTCIFSVKIPRKLSRKYY